MGSLWRTFYSTVIAALVCVGAIGAASELWFFNVNVSYRTGDYYHMMLCRHSLYWTASRDDLAHLMFPPDGRAWRVTTSAYSVSGAKVDRRQWKPFGSAAANWGRSREVYVSFWWALPLAMALVAARIGARRLQRQAHECRGCRYDLRGLPEGATACPECGAEIAQAQREIEA